MKPSLKTYLSRAYRAHVHSNFTRGVQFHKLEVTRGTGIERREK